MKQHLQMTLSLVMALNATAVHAAPAPTEPSQAVVESTQGRRSHLREEIRQRLHDLSAIKEQMEHATGSAPLGDVTALTQWTTIEGSPILSGWFMNKLNRSDFTSAEAKVPVLYMAPAGPYEAEVITRRTADPAWQCVQQAISRVRTAREGQHDPEPSVHRLHSLQNLIKAYNEAMLEAQQNLALLTLTQDPRAAELTTRLQAFDEWRRKKNILVIMTNLTNLKERCQGDVDKALLASTQAINLNVANPTNVRDWVRQISPQERERIDAQISDVQRQMYRTMLALNLTSARFDSEIKSVAGQINAVERPQERYVRGTFPQTVYVPDAGGIVIGAALLGAGGFVLREIIKNKKPKQGLGGGSFLLAMASMAGMVFGGLSLMVSLGRGTPETQYTVVDKDMMVDHVKKLKTLVLSDEQFGKTILKVVQDWQKILDLDASQAAQLTTALRSRIVYAIEQTNLGDLHKGKFELNVDIKSLLKELKMIDESDLQTLTQIDEQAAKAGAQLALSDASAINIEDALRLDTFKLRSLVEIYEKLAEQLHGEAGDKLRARVSDMKLALKNAEYTLKLVATYDKAP